MGTCRSYVSRASSYQTTASRYTCCIPAAMSALRNGESLFPTSSTPCTRVASATFCNGSNSMMSLPASRTLFFCRSLIVSVSAIAASVSPNCPGRNPGRNARLRMRISPSFARVSGSAAIRSGRLYVSNRSCHSRLKFLSERTRTISSEYFCLARMLCAANRSRVEPIARYTPVGTDGASVSNAGGTGVSGEASGGLGRNWLSPSEGGMSSSSPVDVFLVASMNPAAPNFFLIALANPWYGYESEISKSFSAVARASCASKRFSSEIWNANTRLLSIFSRPTFTSTLMRFPLSSASQKSFGSHSLGGSSLHSSQMSLGVFNPSGIRSVLILSGMHKLYRKDGGP